jgi:hypothetical protein
MEKDLKGGGSSLLQVLLSRSTGETEIKHVSTADIHC